MREIKGSGPKIKKTKVKKIKQYSTVKSLTTIIVALVFSMVIFAGLIYLNNFVKEDISYSNVIIAKTNIPENLYITKDNAADYFCIKPRDLTTLSKDCVHTLDNYMNKYVSREITQNEIITSKDFKELTTDEFENPVEVSMQVDNLGNSICGKLRAGDVVNITITTKTNNGISDGIKTYEDVIITRAFDSSCTLIQAGDFESNTAYITFNIEKANELELNTILNYASSIRISRKLR